MSVSRVIARAGGRVAIPAVVLVLTLLVSACAFDRPRVQVDGSSTVFPLTEAVVEEFQKQNRHVATTVGVSGTGGGFKRFCASETDVTGASRPISDGEREDCREQGVDWIELAVAVDALSVVVHPENDWVADDCLGVEQLHEAWRSGSDVRLWSDLDPDWPELEIRFYSPGHDSGTFDYFTDVINGETGNSRTAGVLFNSDQEMLVRGVSGDRGSLGYFGYAHYLESRDKLKALAVEGGEGCASPSPETVEDGVYVLARPVFLYVNVDHLTEPEVESFVRFYLSHVEELTADVGFMPLPPGAFRETFDRFREAVGS